MVKYCPRCGTPNDDNAQFCVKCGYKFMSTSNKFEHKKVYPPQNEDEESHLI
ncbi:MAG: zinc-ribbon domain-containing protein [Thermoplasmata archaeon]